jgi:hypothetical protein
MTWMLLWVTLSQDFSAPPLVSGEPVATARLSADSLARYQQASAAVVAGRYAEATALLNTLAVTNPQVAEIFAARCSAQLGLANDGYAEADCAYALRLKPGLAAAQQGLQLARARAAAARERTQQLRAPPPAPREEPRERAECRMSTNGQQACGYHCMMGTDGIFVCADTPEGVCAMSTNGRITCSHLGSQRAESSVKPDCPMGSNGQRTCGYNCRYGSNGRWYCASTPDGTCAFNSNGTWTCS